MRIHLSLSAVLITAFFSFTSSGLGQSFGTNLIVNGDAESGPGVGGNTIVSSIPGWTSSGANVITYASGYGIALSDLVPIGAGQNYFSNGTTSSSMAQTVSLSFAATAIDAGIGSFDASGYFGGYGSYDDTATLNISFLNASGAALSSVSVGGRHPMISLALYCHLLTRYQSRSNMPFITSEHRASLPRTES